LFIWQKIYATGYAGAMSDKTCPPCLDYSTGPSLRRENAKADFTATLVSIRSRRILMKSCLMEIEIETAKWYHNYWCIYIYRSRGTQLQIQMVLVESVCLDYNFKNKI